MAYTIPVVALIVDLTAAATALGLSSDFFEDVDEDRSSAVEDLAKLTSAPLTYFSDEDGDCFDIGLEMETEFYIAIDAALLAKAVALRIKYPHPLIQSAQLAVVSEFN